MSHQSLDDCNYISLATFRKSGVEVANPVWFAEADGFYYVFSAGEAGKVKRLRNSSRARIAPCTVSGSVTGDWCDAEASLIETAEDLKKAKRAFRCKYGWQWHSINFFSRLGGKINQRAFIRIKALP